MPYNVQHRGSSYVVVDDSGKVVGTHDTKQEAINHQRALYANVPDASKNMNLYEMLTPVEKAYHDALVGVVAQHGYFDQGTQSVWVGYEGAEENENASIGVMCANCSFYKQGGGCQIVSFKVEAGGYCRLAAIPDNLINKPEEEEEMEDVEKQSPCWEGYVQRGMKPGKDGKMVPNCVPATTKAYNGCGCPTCKEMDVSCEECPVCNSEMDKAAGVRVGQMVSWNSSGGRAEGKVKRIIRDGSYNVPNSDFTINGTPESPAAVIELYRDGKPTGRMVGHKLETLTTKKSLWAGTFDPRYGMMKNG